MKKDIFRYRFSPSSTYVLETIQYRIYFGDEIISETDVKLENKKQ